MYMTLFLCAKCALELERGYETVEIPNSFAATHAGFAVRNALAASTISAKSRQRKSSIGRKDNYQKA